VTVKDKLLRSSAKNSQTAVEETGIEKNLPSEVRRHLPENSLEGVPDLCTELAATLRAIVRGDESPRSIMHSFLLRDNEPRTVESLAADLGWSSAEVEWSVEVLVEENWAIEFVENGLRKFVLYVPHKEYEAQPYLPSDR
jgi:hypothetical protein